MPPRLLQELSKLRVRGVSTDGGTNIFDFNGPDELKADFIFCFVWTLLFLLLLGVAIINIRELVGRERTPAVLLLIAILSFAVYYGMSFASVATGPEVYDILSEDVLAAFGGVAFQFYNTAIALMLCALLFFNNCTFELGQPSNSLIGLPSRMWAVIISGIFYIFATLQNILASAIFVALENGATGTALAAPKRANDAFLVLSGIIMIGVSVFLFYCSLVGPRGGPADQFRRTLRFVIAPVLILGSIISLALTIADIVISNQLDKAFKSHNHFNSTKIESLQKSQLQVDLGYRVNEGLTNFQVVLIALSACAHIWNGNKRRIPQQLEMATVPSDYYLQRPFVPQQPHAPSI